MNSRSRRAGPISTGSVNTAVPPHPNTRGASATTAGRFRSGTKGRVSRQKTALKLPDRNGRAAPSALARNRRPSGKPSVAHRSRASCSVVHRSWTCGISDAESSSTAQTPPYETAATAKSGRSSSPHRASAHRAPCRQLSAPRGTCGRKTNARYEKNSHRGNNAVPGSCAIAWRDEFVWLPSFGKLPSNHALQVLEPGQELYQRCAQNPLS